MSKVRSQKPGNPETARQPMEAEKGFSFFDWIIHLFLPKKNKKLRTNRYMLYSSLLMIFAFFAFMGYLGYFITYQSRDILANSHNKRTSSYSDRTKRGSILSADGEVLAVTNVDDEGNETREYPYGSLFAHVVGYATHGKAGLEALCNYSLLSTHDDLFTQLENGVYGDKNPGDNVVTTLNTKIQEAAYDALDDYKGAVVVIEPKTGRVLSLVSKPDFDANELDDIWDDINEDSSNSCLVNRVTQGLYPPGSTYKVVTALEYLEENPDTYEDFSYDCTGETVVQSVHIHCYQEEEHGTVNLEEAFAQSCNTAFVTIGSSLNLDSFVHLNQSLLFNQSIKFDLKVKQSQFELTGKSEESQVPQTVIGQGDTLMTPFHNALIMCAIANDGVLMKPYLVDHYESSNGGAFDETKEEEYGQLIDPSYAKKLQTMLRSVVTDGTGYSVDTDEYEAYGKTGTAENSGEDPHSWFVGYANKGEKSVVVCVLAENCGTGSKYAAPMAAKIFDAYFEE